MRCHVTDVDAGAAALTTALNGQQTLKVDPSVTAYQQASGISGNLSSIGSDSRKRGCHLIG